MKKKITHNDPVYCRKKGCKKIIGYYDYNKRERWHDGVHQCGYFSTCSEKHLRLAMEGK